MKKLLLLAFSATTLYCNAQEKIVLVTGDSLIGIVSEIVDQYGNTDSYHSRITKPDGTSVMILTNMIKNKGGASSMKSDINGDNLALSEKIMYKSIGIIGLGIATWTIGAVLIMPAVAIIGGVIIFEGGLYSITAVEKIRKAGEYLKKKKRSHISAISTNNS